MFNIFKRFERKKDPSVSDSVSEYSASSNLDTKIPRRKPPPLYSRSSPSTSVDSVRGIRSASLPLPSDISENVSNEYPSVLEKKEKSKRRVSYLDLLETSGCHATCDSKNLSPVYSCEALRSIINEYRRKYVGFSDSSPCDDSFYRVNDLHEDELNLTNQQYKFATEICSTYNSSLEADIKIKVEREASTVMDSYGFDVEDGDDDSGCERGSKGRSPCERGDPILPDKCMPENDSSVANSSLDSGCGCLFNASDHSYSLMRLYEDVTDTSPSLTEADPSSEKIKKESEVKREIQRSVSDSHGFSISETSEKVCYHQVEGTEACLGSNSVLACEDKEEFSVSNDDLPTTTDYEMHAEVQTKSTEVQAVASKMQPLASLSDPSCLQNSQVGESFGSSLDSLTEKSVVSSKEQNVFESTGLLRSETDEDNTPRRRNGIESSKSVGISTSNGSSSYVEESNQEKMESFVIIPSDDEQDYLYDESDTDSHCEKTEGVHRGNGNQACEDAKDTPCLCSRGEEIREFDKTEGFKKSDTERSEATSNHNKNDCTESEEVKESAGAVPNIAKTNASTSDLSNTDACEVRSTGFVQATTSSLLCLGRSHTVNRRPPKRRINREEKTDATKGCNSVSSLELNTPEDDVVLIKKHVAPELLEIEDEIIAKSCPSDIYDYSTDTKNSLYEDDVIFEQEILSDAETKLVRQILELCRVFIDTVDTADPNWCQKLKYGVLQQLKFLIVGTKNAQFEQERLMKRRILLERGIKMRKEALEARQRRKAPVTQPSLSSPSVPCAGSDFDNPPCLVKEVKAERSQNTSVNCCPKSFEDNQFHPVVVDQVQGQRDATFDKFSRGVRVIHMKGPLDPSVRGRFEGPSTTRKIFGPSSNNNIAFTGRLVSLTGPEGSRRLVRIIRRPANGSVVAMK